MSTTQSTDRRTAPKWSIPGTKFFYREFPDAEISFTTVYSSENEARCIAIDIMGTDHAMDFMIQQMVQTIKWAKRNRTLWAGGWLNYAYLWLTCETNRDRKDLAGYSRQIKHMKKNNPKDYEKYKKTILLAHD